MPRKPSPPPPPPSPVVTPTHLASTEARIEHIAGEMRALRFVRGKTIRELAAEWGVQVGWVRKLSSTASRRVRIEVASPKAAQRDVMVTLRAIMVAGLAPDGDKKAALKACELTAELLGFAPAKRTELTGKGGKPLAFTLDLTTLTDDELAALARGESIARPPSEG
jgi:hypothetical protein